MRCCSLFAALSLVASVCCIAQAADLPPKGEVDYKTDVVYATTGGEELKMDIATPKGLDHAVPAIVVIHGGGWMGGRRQDMAGFARQLAGYGYVAATISY